MFRQVSCDLTGKLKTTVLQDFLARSSRINDFQGFLLAALLAAQESRMVF